MVFVSCARVASNAARVCAVCSLTVKDRRVSKEKAVECRDERWTGVIDDWVL